MAKGRPTRGVPRRRRTREQWQELVRRYEASEGVTQVEFARQQGLNVRSLRYWLWKLRSERKHRRDKRVHGGDRRQREQASPPVKFVEVTSTPVAEHTACRVRVGTEVTVELDTLPPAAWIRELAKE